MNPKKVKCVECDLEIALVGIGQWEHVVEIGGPAPSPTPHVARPADPEVGAASMLESSSAVSARTGLPGVVLRFRGNEMWLGLPEAREIAHAIVEAAAAAEMDALFVRFMQRRVGIDLPRAVAMLRELRVMREQMLSEIPAPSEELPKPGTIKQ